MHAVKLGKMRQRERRLECPHCSAHRAEGRVASAWYWAGLGIQSDEAEPGRSHAGVRTVHVIAHDVFTRCRLGLGPYAGVVIGTKPSSGA